MKWRIKIEGEIILEADGIMQAKTLWDWLRKEGMPYIMGTCSASFAAPHHDYRDGVRHRASSDAKVTYIGEMEPIKDTASDQRAGASPAPPESRC